MNETFRQVDTDTNDLMDLVEELAPFVDKWPRSQVLMATLFIALWCQNPRLSPDQLRQGIMEASQWLALYVSGLDKLPTEAIEKTKVN